MNMPSSNLVIVCLSDHPKAMMLLRTAQLRAQEQSAKWCAIFIETPADTDSNEYASQERMLRLLTLARQMGAETRHIEASSVEKGITSLLEAEKGHISLLIAGDSEAEHWWEQLLPSLGKRSANIARQNQIKTELLPLSGQHYRRSWRERLRWVRLPHIAYALIAVGIAYLSVLGLQELFPAALLRINNQNVSLVFMIACTFIAGRFGLLPGLITSATSFLTVHYFFTPPYNVLSVTKLTNITDMLNMALFLSATILVSVFTGQTHGYAEKVAKRELGTRALFTLYRIAINASSREQALTELQQELKRMLRMEVAFFLPPTMRPDDIEPVFPASLALLPAERDALLLCWKEMKTTGLASPSWSKISWRFEPMLAASGEIGVLGVRPSKRFPLDAWYGRLLTAVAEQTAAVLEHIELVHLMEASRIREEREKLRAMLLSSVSHDLKTPLASIMAALTIFRSQGRKLDAQKRDSLIDTALDESERLDNFINNILQITRLESGVITFRQEWHNLGTLLRSIARRSHYRLRQHTLILQPSLNDIEVYMDPIMNEQVLQNIIDNACKYTPAGTRIEVSGAEENNKFYCAIHDSGNGLPSEKYAHIFDKYARLQKQDSQVAGTGLGLAICKAIMEAQNGAITATSHEDGGAVFTLIFSNWRKTETASQTAASSAFGEAEILSGIVSIR